MATCEEVNTTAQIKGLASSLEANFNEQLQNNNEQLYDDGKGESNIQKLILDKISWRMKN